MSFSKDMLKIDTAAEINRITSSVRDQVVNILKRRGAVVGLSGGIDSSVCAALCAKALGSENVMVIFMPDRDSSGESLKEKNLPILSLFSVFSFLFSVDG